MKKKCLIKIGTYIINAFLLISIYYAGSMCIEYFKYITLVSPSEGIIINIITNPILYELLLVTYLFYKKKNLTKTLLTICLLLISIVLIEINREDFSIARSSAPVTVIRVPLIYQWLAQAMLIGIISYLLYKKGRVFQKKAAIFSFFLILSVYIFSIHAVCFRVCEHITDVWGFIYIQQIDVIKDDSKAFPEGSLRRINPFLVVIRSDLNQEMTVFLGIPPWNLNVKELEKRLAR